jgi:hypothetical protein
MKHDMDGPRIIVTENVNEYRAAIKKYVSATDICLEAGCAGGATTNKMSKLCVKAVGIDKNTSPRVLALQEELSGQSENLSFYQYDAFDFSSLLKLKLKFNVIFIDLSGDRLPGVITGLMER